MKKKFFMAILLFVVSITVGSIPYSKTEIIEMNAIKGSTVRGNPSNGIWEMSGAFSANRTLQIPDFAIGKYEITKKQYRLVMMSNKLGLYVDPSSSCIDSSSSAYEDDDNSPVESVTWFDAVYFCNRLSSMLNMKPSYIITNIIVRDGHIVKANVKLVSKPKGGRLPTEAEWEFAARGGCPSFTEWHYAYSGVDSEEKKVLIKILHWIKLPGIITIL